MFLAPRKHPCLRFSYRSPCSASFQSLLNFTCTHFVVLTFAIEMSLVSQFSVAGIGLSAAALVAYYCYCRMSQGVDGCVFCDTIRSKKELHLESNEKVGLFDILGA